MTESRPSPDALLRAAAREGQGRLRIFLGAAPGVGKTWAMLSAARARMADGVDVVAGVIETHGRAETEALARGIETVPRRRLRRGGVALEEMDLEALLARRPALALVDELAHSNALDDSGQGSRHPKRWQDVLDLLDAGIDVWTTLNIQHIESLNDVVARITRIRVRETVPDSVIDRADEMSLVDITPDDLIRRLGEGKVYVPETARRAVANYFSRGNLTALRELALRATARRVDSELLQHMQAHAIPGPWAAGSCILVCLAGDGADEALVRRGRQLADLNRARWMVLHVEAAGPSAPPGLDAAMRLAASLGAETRTVPGQDVAQEIIAFAREQNATELVVGWRARPWWRLDRPLASRLLAAGEWPVHALPAGGAPRPSPMPRPRLGAGHVALALGVVALATLVGLVLREVLAVANIGLVYLTAVLVVATLAGLWPSLLACLASMVAFNFFFIPPIYSLTIADPENVVALFFFAVVAVVASNLAASVRAQAVSARERARTTEALYGFSRKLAGIADLDDLLWAVAYQIAAMLRLHVMLLLPDKAGRLAPRAGYPPDDRLAEADLAAAQWCFEHARPTGRGADTLPGARWRFVPLRAGTTSLGVLGLDRDDAARQTPLLTAVQERLLDALVDQSAVSIERVRLAEDLDRTRLAAETERMRAALLTAVSHDLRTPLASIRGAAETIVSYGPTLAEADRDGLLASIIEESERLGRFVANLLDMTRLEAGAVVARREPTDIGESIGSALARASGILARHRVEIAVEEGLDLSMLDPVLFEQVLVNLLDNAAKYAPAGGTVTLRAARVGGRMEVHVLDEGPGIDPATAESLFIPFHRGGRDDGRPAGTGLGLAICRGFMTAMGGAIEARNRTDRAGADFVLILPEAAA